MTAVGALLVVLLADAGAPPAPPPPPPPPPTGGGTVLLAHGATWQVATATAPRPTRQVAAVALGGLDVAAGRRAAGVPIAGEDADGTPPPAWPLANRPDAATLTAPLTPVPAEGDRVALLWATSRFEVPADVGDLRVLDIHARYGDGIVIWVNGVEVARRRIPVTSRAMAMASTLRGPEWETFHVPVVPGLLRAGDNVVAMQVRPSGRIVAPTLDVEIVGRPAAQLVRGPLLAGVTADAATIVVETDLATDAAVEWGPTEALGTRVEGAPGRRRVHTIPITGLPASAPVYYRAVVGGAATPVRSFRTLPTRGEVVRIAVYGDVRGGHTVHQQIVDHIRAEDPDLVLGTGDLVLRGTDEGDWQRFFSITSELLATVPFWSAPGNHDTGRAGDARVRFADLLAVPTAPPPRPDWASWYSIDVADVHIAFLDSNAYDEAAQLDWLERDLGAARGRGARVLLALVHDGPFSRGDHGGNAIAAVRYVPVLVKHGVSLLFSGHDHIYQRGTMDDLDYIVTGGGGAPLYTITCGVPGKKACRVADGMDFAAAEHHYVLLTVYPDFLETCARRPDGTPLEECARHPIR